jgi:hypothetical protein
MYSLSLSLSLSLWCRKTFKKKKGLRIASGEKRVVITFNGRPGKACCNHLQREAFARVPLLILEYVLVLGVGVRYYIRRDAGESLQLLKFLSK